jgi:hypothetical protein
MPTIAWSRRSPSLLFANSVTSLPVNQVAASPREAADLAALLQAGGNKALAASRGHMAQPTLYQRLRVIEAMLGVSLADTESRASLHAALLALWPDGCGRAYGRTSPRPSAFV